MKNILKKIGIVIALLGGILTLAVVVMYINSVRKLNQTYTFASETLVIPTDDQSLADGKHWVQALCTHCHGADLAGIAMINDPAIGHVDSANLTSGNGGIASTYTREDWIRVFRHGVGRDGKPLLIMPSSAFWHFSEDDLGEIIAYLKTIPPVDHQTTVQLSPLGTIVLPNDPTVLHVNLIDHNTRPEQPVIGVTAGYGQYLLNISGCRDCHGMDLSGKPSQNNRPAMPNLTPGGELQAWSVDDFIRTIRTGVAPSGHALNSDEMPWQGYGLYSDDELTAIFLYLQSLPALTFNNK